MYYDYFPSPRCDYGYRAIDSNDINFEGFPVYDWIELNEIENAENLLLQDDTLTSVQLPFDFKYSGNFLDPFSDKLIMCFSKSFSFFM